ncbi:choline trimethylamine-lyase [Desulfosediminicola sp.]|uniref:choline trimethylamine-lyase n=1 Tax=Desulfosediminicola sp. TaxID=2886825 RepID=UPI003AF1F295
MTIQTDCGNDQPNPEYKNVEVFPRIERLKARYLKVKPTISIGRALAVTAVEKLHGSQSAQMRRAMGFRRSCETAPLLVQDEELIVGHPTGRARSGSFSPDTAWRWLRDELDTIGTRSQDPYLISEEDKEILKREIFPFWEGKSLDEACEKLFREEGLWEFSIDACVSDLSYHHTSGGGDTSPGYDIILLTKGIHGIRSEAVHRLGELDRQAGETNEKGDYYRAVIETCDGIIAYCDRLSAHVMTLAENEQEPARKAELLELARITRRVPANPPQTFHEALQALWTIQSLFLLEENQCSTSLGRVDQYLYPYFYADKLTGRIDDEKALELLGCFIIKCSEMIWYTPESTAKYFAGYMPFINITVGGQTTKGLDATNELTYLFMEAVKKVGVYQPSLACRIHNDSPQEYLEKIVDVVRAGGGMPACHFDDAHVKMMLQKGFELEEARDYCLMGCVEPQRSGRLHQWTVGGFTQWPIAIEMVFNRGVVKSHGSRQGLDTGELSQLNSYQEFEAAVKKQLEHIMALTARGTVINQKLVRDVAPQPYMSLFVDGCMESAKDVTAGGAVRYAGPGTIFAGLGTYVDSMAAIKRLVFDEGKYSLQEMKEALDADWKGYEQLRRDCLNAPKYGNDDDYADLITADIVDFTETTMNGHQSLYASMIHGTLSQSFNTPLGELVGATPDGRAAWAPLSDGMSPTQGADKKGPTAIIKSVSKMDVEQMSLGMAHNFKVVRGSLENAEGRAGLITLLKTASVLGNGQMQFNYTDNETLKKAQQNPDEYRDLMVRVAGYSAFFVELCKEVQDEIISRTSLE